MTLPDPEFVDAIRGARELRQARFNAEAKKHIAELEYLEQTEQKTLTNCNEPKTTILRKKKQNTKGE